MNEILMNELMLMNEWNVNDMICILRKVNKEIVLRYINILSMNEMLMHEWNGNVWMKC